MTEAQAILKMIEEVDPADTDKLDEIDARLWCYYYGRPYRSVKETKESYPRFITKSGPWRNFTRSRDALKSIRPEGWEFLIQNRAEDFVWFCQMINKPGEHIHYVDGGLPTEELAELHAIIQAIEFEKEAERIKG